VNAIGVLPGVPSAPFPFTDTSLTTTDQVRMWCHAAIQVMFMHPAATFVIRRALLSVLTAYPMLKAFWTSPAKKRGTGKIPAFPEERAPKTMEIGEKNMIRDEEGQRMENQEMLSSF